MSDKPATREDVNWERAWHHCSKSGRVDVLGGTYEQVYFMCRGCDQRWTARVVDRFTDQDIADRFYVPPSRDPENYMIVWGTEGKKCFAKVVQIRGAVGKEKVDF